MDTPCFFDAVLGPKLRFRAALLFCVCLAFGARSQPFIETSVTNSEAFQRAKAIRIQEFALQGSTILSAVNQLNRIGKGNEGTGVYILLQHAARLTAEAKLTLLLKDVSLAEAVEKLCLTAHLKLEVKGRYLSLNSLHPVEVEYLTFDMVNDRPDMKKLADEGWQMFFVTNEGPWLGGANKPERHTFTYCRKKTGFSSYTPPF